MKLFISSLAVALLAIAPTLPAEEMLVGNVRVVQVEGTATLIDGAGRKSEVKTGTFIRQGSKIITGSGSTVALVFENGSSVSVQPSSQFSIDEFVQDPFKAENLNYQKVDKAPSRAVTKLSVPSGDIIFHVAKLKQGSTFDIKTPVGTAGIRGTSGRAGGGGLALATGQASFSPPGQPAVNVNAGQQASPAGVSPAPAGTVAQVATTVGAVNSATPPATFAAAPPNITPAQQSAINAAVAQGGDAVAQVAAQLAGAAPEAAADVAAVAAAMVPAAAPQIAAQVVSTVPSAAVAVAQSTAAMASAAAPQIAAQVASVVPAAAVAVAQAVAQAAPQQAQAVAQAVVAAVPSADAAAVSAAANAGASAGDAAAANQTANTGDQGTINQGQTLPGSGNRPPGPSN
jgi:hypothetical protein